MKSKKLINSFEFYVYAITELRKNGATIKEIAEEIKSTEKQVISFLKECKKKGVEVEKGELVLECTSGIAKDCMKYVKRKFKPKGGETCISCKQEQQRRINNEYKKKQGR